MDTEVRLGIYLCGVQLGVKSANSDRVDNLSLSYGGSVRSDSFPSYGSSDRSVMLDRFIGPNSLFTEFRCGS